MRFSKPLFIVAATVSTLVSSAAMARDFKLCAQYDASERKMTINTNAGCISSSFGFPYRGLTARIDADRATIIITGETKPAKPHVAGRGVKADCMGGRGPQFILSDVDARRYSVTFNGESKGAADFLTETKACVKLAAHGRQPKNYFETDIPGIDASWKEMPIDKRLSDLDERTVGAIVEKLLLRFPEHLSGAGDEQPEVTISLTTPETGYPQRVFARIEMHGDDGNRMKGLRIVIDIHRDGSGWQVKKIFAQFMDSRGPFAGQWSSTLPPR